MTQKRRKALALGLALIAASFSLGLGGCGSGMPTRSGDPSTQQVATDTNNSQTPQSDPQPTGPATDPGNVPTNIPQPIPTPQPPITPGKLSVNATSYSESSYPLNPFGNSAQLVDIHIDLKWQLYSGAVAYRILRNDSTLPADQYAQMATVNANSLNPLLPLFWREYSIPVVNPLVPGSKYTFMVEALDSSNQVLARGTDTTSPLYPLGVPKLIAPKNNDAGVTIQPTFQWNPVNNAEGYFIEVFSGSNFLPMWRGFVKGEQQQSMVYGTTGDSYPGTMPSIWTSILTPGARYTWTVTAYKTDTGNASTAKAFAESNAPAQIFTP